MSLYLPNLPKLLQNEACFLGRKIINCHVFLGCYVHAWIGQLQMFPEYCFFGRNITLLKGLAAKCMNVLRYEWVNKFSWGSLLSSTLRLQTSVLSQPLVGCAFLPCLSCSPVVRAWRCSSRRGPSHPAPAIGTHTRACVLSGQALCAK